MAIKAVQRIEAAAAAAQEPAQAIPRIVKVAISCFIAVAHLSIRRSDILNSDTRPFPCCR